MLNKYKQLSTNNLIDIQSEILNILPFEKLHEIATYRLTQLNQKGTIHFNIPPTEYLFEHSPSLFNFFKQIGISDFPEAIKIGVNFTPPDFLGTIHVDGLSDIATYSINIPIANYVGTFLNTFNTNNSEHLVHPYAASAYKYYKPEECELISSNETVTPYIINVLSPHQFHNPHKDTYRYMVICKIKKQYENVNDIVEKLFNTD
jgi:hypothetical protein